MEDAPWLSLDRHQGRIDDDERTPLWYRLFDDPGLTGEGEREGAGESEEERL